MLEEKINDVPKPEIYFCYQCKGFRFIKADSFIGNCSKKNIPVDHSDYCCERFMKK